MPDLSDAQKAKVAFVLTFIGSLATWAITEFPDNDDVQTWAGLVSAILTILITTYGVWKVANTPKVEVLPAAPPPVVPPAA